MTGLLLKLFTVMTLLTLFCQDMRSRSIHWALLLLLTGMFVMARALVGEHLMNILQSTAVNLAFISLQLLLVTLYFSFKAGSLVNITSGLLGWGDVLFLVSTTFLLPVLPFVIFYLASLVLVLLGWGMFLYARSIKAKTVARKTAVTPMNLAEKYTIETDDAPTIPLAGLQALLLAAALLVSWAFPQSGIVKLARELQTFELWS